MKCSFLTKKKILALAKVLQSLNRCLQNFQENRFLIFILSKSLKQKVPFFHIFKNSIFRMKSVILSLALCSCILAIEVNHCKVHIFIFMCFVQTENLNWSNFGGLYIVLVNVLDIFERLKKKNSRISQLSEVKFCFYQTLHYLYSKKI